MYTVRFGSVRFVLVSERCITALENREEMEVVVPPEELELKLLGPKWNDLAIANDRTGKLIVAQVISWRCRSRERGITEEVLILD